MTKNPFWTEEIENDFEELRKIGIRERLITDIEILTKRLYKSAKECSIEDVLTEYGSLDNKFRKIFADLRDKFLEGEISLKVATKGTKLIDNAQEKIKKKVAEIMKSKCL